ncbi:hypothetical protein DYB37_004891 [Aphanomyces astaci]|uniref:Phosphodiesterase n=1 Tax=Aphanomyces astaci TaxID=112090 RepID=A0A397ANA3_APHAT|nr:hypothetical protein DYB36_001138 [Aphanomyces astaci]RHZ17342.1 hypothetical protein DYB37_004891 [Aphanomyces astaci]
MFALVEQILMQEDLYAIADVLSAHVRSLFLPDVAASKVTSAVFLVDHNTTSLAKIDSTNLTVHSHSLNRGLAGLAVRSSIPFVGTDFALTFDPDVDIALAGSPCMSCIPLLNSSLSVFAVLQVRSPEPGLSMCDVDFLQRVGPILNQCLRKSIEFHDIVLRQRTQAALLHLVNSSSTEETILKLMERVINGSTHIVHAQRVTLFLVDWTRNELWSLQPTFRHTRVRLDASCLLGNAALKGCIINVRDAATDPRFHPPVDDPLQTGIITALYVPIGIPHGTADAAPPMAVLECINKLKPDGSSLSTEGFTNDDECAFEAYASEVAVVLRRRAHDTEYLKLLGDSAALASTSLEGTAAAATNRPLSSLLLDAWSSPSSPMANSNCNNSSNPPPPRRIHTPNLVIDTLHLREGGSTSAAASAAASSSALPPSPLSSLPAKPLLLSPRRFCVEGDVTAVPGWDLDVFIHDTDQLLGFAEQMLRDPRLVGPHDLNVPTLQSFLQVVHDHYHPNPFHNFQHGFSVLHVSYRILTDTHARRVLHPLDRLACLVASLCHDIDHPGHSNVFEIHSNSSLALTHNDDAVLERHHAATTFRLLQDPRVNIFASFPTSDFRYVRKAIVRAILGTDMAVHNDTIDALVSRFQPLPTATTPVKPPPLHHPTLASSVSSSASTSSGDSTGSLPSATCESPDVVSFPPSSPPPPWRVFENSEDDRLFLVKAIVHAADLSAQVFPKHIALKWSNMIAKEFAYQALMESAEGLPVTHQHVDDPLLMVESQHFFAARLVAPLWVALVQFFPQLHHCMTNLHANIAHYEVEIRRLQACGTACQKENADSNDKVPVLPAPTNEGQAVPGINKNTPAKFNSFRIRAASNTTPLLTPSPTSLSPLSISPRKSHHQLLHISTTSEEDYTADNVITLE